MSVGTRSMPRIKYLNDIPSGTEEILFCFGDFVPCEL